LITFEPVSETHRPLLQRWLAQPHWREWWGEPEEELRLIYAVEDGEHLPFIACIEGNPVAYVQCWCPAKHPSVSWVADMAKTERGIDIAIGDANDLNKGFGSLIVKHFAAKLFAEGATRLVIDPDKKNARAIAAYMKAGFTPYAEFDGDLLMELLPKDFDYGAGHAQDRGTP
jgi:aminoglycoside 6'-N-acetyltransferase